MKYTTLLALMGAASADDSNHKVSKMMAPGCISKLNQMEKPVLDAIEGSKYDADPTKRTAAYRTSKWFKEFHSIFAYETTGSGDQEREYLVEDLDLFKSYDFNGQSRAVIAAMKKYPNPYGD